MTKLAFEIMGIVNLTTDSFSDGGLYIKTEEAIKRVDELLEQGADYIDFGAESTRPGAEKIPAEEEYSRLARVLDILKEKKYSDLKISIDTRKPEVARKIIQNYKIAVINHIAEERFDDDLLIDMAHKNIAYVSMHTQKNSHLKFSEGMTKEEALPAVDKFFRSTQERLLNLGFKPENIILDPGVGYAKDLGAQLMVIKNVREYSKNYNILMGVSRKSWLGKMFGIDNPIDREQLSKLAELMLTFLGAKIIRTHEVGKLSKLRKLVS